MAKRQKRQRAKRGHGTTAMYKAGCRCPECKKAMHGYYEQRKAARKRNENASLLEKAASLYGMVYTVGGETRVFVYPPMSDEEETE